MAFPTMTPDRPRDESVYAIRAALAAVTRDVAAARARLTRARADAAAAVVSGQSGAIRHAGADVEAAESALRQFQQMRSQMAVRLARAEAGARPASPHRSDREPS